jgi:hypothetical protein
MKAQFSFFLLIIWVIISCSKSDELTPDTTQKISIGNKDYTFEGAGVIDYGYDNWWKDYSKGFFLSNPIVTSEDDISKVSHGIYFHAINKEKEFKLGNFVADESENQYGTLFFIENGSSIPMIEGQFTISANAGNTLKVDINGELADGREIKGTYINAFKDLPIGILDELISFEREKVGLFNIGNKEYSFKGSGLIDYGYNNEVHEYWMDFFLTSEKMTEKKGLSTYDYLIFLETHSVGNLFTSGIFTPDENHPKQYGTILFYENEEASLLKSGSFTITKGTGNEYTISIDGVLESGRKIKGVFNGDFPQFSDSIFYGAAKINEPIEFKIKQ